jgi:hypothetical protein
MSDDDDEEKEKDEYDDVGHRADTTAAGMEPAPGSLFSSMGDDSEVYAEDVTKIQVMGFSDGGERPLFEARLLSGSDRVVVVGD